MGTKQKGGSITLSWGEYGGFYVRFKYTKRICLGWISLTYIPIDIDELLDK